MERAWAAGFWDGEGSATCTRNLSHLDGSLGSLNAQISVSQSGDGAVELLERFQKAVDGLGKIKGPYGPYRGNRLPRWEWRLHSYQDVLTFTRLLWPFLGNVKRQQLRRILGLSSHRPYYTACHTESQASRNNCSQINLRSGEAAPPGSA